MLKLIYVHVKCIYVYAHTNCTIFSHKDAKLAKIYRSKLNTGYTDITFLVLIYDRIYMMIRMQCFFPFQKKGKICNDSSLKAVRTIDYKCLGLK